MSSYAIEEPTWSQKTFIEIQFASTECQLSIEELDLTDLDSQLIELEATKGEISLSTSLTDEIAYVQEIFDAIGYDPELCGELTFELLADEADSLLLSIDQDSQSISLTP